MLTIGLLVLLALFLIVVVSVAEFKEGMIHILDGDYGDVVKGDGKGGVKSHWYYSISYHNMNTTSHLYAFISGIVFSLIVLVVDVPIVVLGVYIMGVMFLMWSCSEACYSYARYGNIYHSYERVVFPLFGEDKYIIIKGVGLYVWVFGRFVLGSWLFIKALCMV
jgi:hypothetical protein